MIIPDLRSGDFIRIDRLLPFEEKDLTTNLSDQIEFDRHSREDGYFLSMDIFCQYQDSVRIQWFWLLNLDWKLTESWLKLGSAHWNWVLSIDPSLNLDWILPESWFCLLNRYWILVLPTVQESIFRTWSSEVEDFWGSDYLSEISWTFTLSTQTNMKSHHR